jgi:hypothetical protein
MLLECPEKLESLTPSVNTFPINELSLLAIPKQSKKLTLLEKI